MDYKKFGLFKIKKVKESLNYELILSKNMNIYLVFYIFLFELVLLRIPNMLFTEIEPVNRNTIYNIETILNYKYIRNKIKYLIK